MNRRYFLRNTTLAGFTLPAIILSACQTGSAKKTPAETTDGKPIDFELDEVTIAALQQKMQNGTYTSRSVTEMYLSRIKAIDQAGPKLNSVIEVNPDAITIADAMDQERKAGKIRGPLHGIPVLIKDNIDTADKMITSAGALALAGNKATRDAFIAKQLRDAGAVLLGKTNLSEWANFRSTRSASGWSSRGGQTKNAYILDRTPCGSSSGSGTAVAANLCAVAVGTETDGSIVCPASVNGVVGIKPTVGLVSRSGIIPISQTQDTAGPLARTVTDAAILLGVLTGIDPSDAVTQGSTNKMHRDYTPFLKASGLQGKRIGIEKSFLKGHESIDSLLQQAMAQLKSQGATIVEVELMEGIKKLGDNEFKVLQYEFKDGVNKYLAQANAGVKSLAEVIAFNKKNENKTMPFFKQEILESSEALGDLTSKEYIQARTKNLTTARQLIDNLLQKHQLQAIAGPTYGPPWCIDLVNGDAFTGYGFTSPAAISGYPNICVPMGQVQGLPIGLSFIGNAYSEPELITIAYAYEQASRNRKTPAFQKSTNPA